MDRDATTDVMVSEGAPESPPQSVLMWARENLFSSRLNGFLTVVASLLVAFVVRNFAAWIFATNRGWEAVFTNMRLYMVQAYPVDQFLRVWISVGIIVVLVTGTLAIWNVGSRVAFSAFFKAVRGAGAALAVAAYLGPPTVDLDFTVGVPVLDWVLGTLTFLTEALLMTGGRLVVFLIGVAVAVVGHLGAKRTKNTDRTFHSLFIPLGVVAAVVLSLWIAPYGHYFFTNTEVVADGEPCTGACFEPGTIASSTQIPWTVLFFVGIAAYFLVRGATKLLGGRSLRPLFILGWGLALPVIVLFILRDPDFNPVSDTGGFDFVTASDVTVWLLFAVLGSVVIGVLSLQRLGEVGKAIAGLLLVGALALWAIPMLMVVRILGLFFGAFAIGAQTFAGDREARITYLGIWVGLVTAMVALVAVIKVPSSLEISGTSFLGGLTLTFVLALTAILLSIPIGILMALGRTSTMPIFRIMSTVYIELVRGIPFITVLIFFSIIFQLFLPAGVEFDEVTLAILAGTLFSAAYMAENVRGGLQSIPKGQYEAAKSMGLSTLQMTVFIVLPQALRAVIPALVGQTIAIFKDTSLVAIIGLFDFLYIADKVVPNQTVFLGIKLENILFISVVYWMFTFSFSRASLRVEKKVGLGER
jgi:His/Glu/Gln/Arg/opine family amino acid ABC transporter permease subunit